MPSITEIVSGAKSASWVIKSLETNEIIMETFNQKVVESLNTEKYKAVPIYEHLTSLNKV